MADLFPSQAMVEWFQCPRVGLEACSGLALSVVGLNFKAKVLR